jgi:cell division septation protein DedD
MKSLHLTFVLALVTGMICAHPSSLTAQDRISLNDVESHLAQGRIVEAREALEAWLVAEGPTASRSDRQRSLWFRAKLTVDPDMAELDLRRLVLEFPGGPFSDDALVRLAQFADAKGNLRTANDYFSDLVRDYPVSPFRSQAEAWLAAHQAEVAALPPRGAPEPPPEPRQEPPPSTEPPEPPILRGQTGSIAIQVGAFQSLDRARWLEARIREAGFSPRLVRVPGSDLLRVRVGRFETRGEADALALDLQELGFETTVATDAEKEEIVG